MINANHEELTADALAVMERTRDPRPREIMVSPVRHLPAFQLIKYARAVLACKCPPPEIFDVILNRFGVPGIVTVTSTISYYMMLIGIMAAFGMSEPLEPIDGGS